MQHYTSLLFIGILHRCDDLGACLDVARIAAHSFVLKLILQIATEGRLVKRRLRGWLCPSLQEVSVSK